jgi:mannose-6-phosphate isomerase
MKDLLGKDIPDGPVGESWEVSPHPNGLSRVANGPLEGSTLPELARDYGARLLGRSAFERYGGAFPLLVKLIDVNALASVQVHPNDEQARRLEGFPFGKAEAWYIVDVRPGAAFCIGFRAGVDEAEFLRALEDGRVEGLLNRVEVRSGDCIHVPPGTVHACGNGVFLLEIQQPCDITYRVFDWNRTDDSGKPRPLHIEKARAVIDYGARPRVHRAARVPNAMNEVLVSPHFSIHEAQVEGELRLPADGSCRAATVVRGRGSLAWAEGSAPLATGESFVLPAEVEGAVVSGECTLIAATIV